MALLIVMFVVLIVLVLIFMQIYTWTDLRTRRLIAKIPGYSELDSWRVSLQGAALSMDGVGDFLNKIFKNYSSLCSLWFLGRPNVYIPCPENLEVIMKSIQHIKKGNEYFILLPWLGEGLLTSSGAKWHANRKLLTPAFHFKILENCIPIFNSNAQLLVKVLKDEIRKNEDVLIIEKFISLCSLDIISESAMGVSLQAQLNNKSTLEYVKAVRRMGELCLHRVKALHLEKEWIYHLTPNGREHKKILRILHSFTEKIIKESKEKRKVQKSKDTDTEKRPEAFVDFILEMAEHSPGVFTDAEIRQEVDTFMFEGHETTTSSLSWTILLLGHDEEVQERVFEELSNIFQGINRRITRQDVSQMVYLDAVIKESLRLYPPVSYISRKLDVDITLDKYIVPSGTNCIIIPYFLHRQSNLYPDPERFNPDRFLNFDSINRHPFMYIPFSGGPRNCIGQRFALMEMKIILACLIRNFKIRSVTQREGLKVLFTPILRPVHGTCVALTPRTELRD